MRVAAAIKPEHYVWSFENEEDMDAKGFIGWKNTLDESGKPLLKNQSNPDWQPGRQFQPEDKWFADFPAMLRWQIAQVKELKPEQVQWEGALDPGDSDSNHASNYRGRKNPYADGRDAYFTAWANKLGMNENADSSSDVSNLSHEFIDPNQVISQDLIDLIADAVNRAYQNSPVEFRDYTYHPYELTGMCEDVSWNLRKELLAHSEHFQEPELVRRLRLGPMETDSGNPEIDGHAFIKIPFEDGQILIDPTYLQFLPSKDKTKYPPALLAFYRTDDELEDILAKLPRMESYVYGYYLGFENPLFKKMHPGPGRVIDNFRIDFMPENYRPPE